MTSLSHSAVTERLVRLGGTTWEPVTSPNRRVRQHTGRRRFATVADAVCEVLAAEGGALRYIEVHARVERLLAGPVPKSSVKNCLAKRSSGPRPLFERVGYGRYRIARS